MSFSVGLYFEDEVSSLLAERDSSLLGLGSACDRVSIWHEGISGWRAHLVTQLRAGALLRYRPERLVKVGHHRHTICEGQPAQDQFLSVTEPGGKVHDRFVLVLREEPVSVFLLTDSDGQALDVFICGDSQHSVCRDVGNSAWQTMNKPPSS